MKVFASRSPLETIEVGIKIGKTLQQGDVVLLSGDLGAGKTEMARGIATGLGSEDPVTSPTYALMNQYRAGLPIYHFDLYRLKNVAELEQLGFEEFAGSGKGVTIVEWPDEFIKCMPDDYIRIFLKRNGPEDERTVSLEAVGPRSVDRVGEWDFLADSGD